MVTSDWEDVEMTPPIVEMLYRGAALEVGLFDPQFISKPVAPLSDYRQGSYGTSVPFHEIPESYYKIVKQGHIPMGSFDIVWIPGAFNPWQIVANPAAMDFLKDAYKNSKIIFRHLPRTDSPCCGGPLEGENGSWLAGLL